MTFTRFGNASTEMIDSFEQHIGFQLPDDYKKFLREYNGGMQADGYPTFYVEELNENIPLSVLYGLNTDKTESDLQDWHDEYADDLIPNSIIIGDDPGSGLIVLLHDPEAKGIYYWDPAFNFEQSTEDQNMYRIAESFSSFFDGLK